MSFREVYECDECGNHRRRLSINKEDGSEAHFCSIGCLNDFVEAWDDDLGWYVRCEDIQDGA